ncbi:ABC transporter substrate-binding protein [Raoultella sp. 10-1]|uniref:ABC transporter substrate-binding protein n=1 Tax=Raoultella sp. 10-1 TaxID=2683201 RepID=UPI001CB9D76D|nr:MULTISPECIES: ABC transporter substrate-binding protein [Enterobacteriaceae]
MKRLAALALLAASASFAHPVTLQNCGHSWTFARVPQRTIVYMPTAMENMLALRLGDAIISAVGYRPDEDTAPSPWYKPLTARLDDAPWSAETLLASRPDFIYSGSYYWFNSPETAGRERMAEWGIASWLIEGMCNGLQSASPASATFASIYAELRNIARIYAVEPRAEALIAELKQRVAADSRIKLPPRTLMWWYSGTATPYVAGGHGAAELLTQTIGSRNIFSDSKELWPAMSWEAIAERDPDYLILGDLRRGGAGDSARSKIDFLEHYPLTAGMKAVKAKHYIILPGYDMDASARSVLALHRLVTQIHAKEQQ